jgi:hypothetical protein
MGAFYYLTTVLRESYIVAHAEHTKRNDQSQSEPEREARTQGRSAERGVDFVGMDSAETAACGRRTAEGGRAMTQRYIHFRDGSLRRVDERGVIMLRIGKAAKKAAKRAKQKARKLGPAYVEKTKVKR